MISHQIAMHCGRLGWACVAAVTLGLAGCDLTDPDQPLSAVELEIVEASTTFVTLRWSAAEPPVRYEVERDGAVVHTTEAVEYTDSNLQPEHVYVYRVRAVAADGRTGAWSYEVPAQTRHCLDLPAGHAIYLPLDVGRSWRFAYTRTRTGEDGGPPHPAWQKDWDGELEWTITSVSCSREGIDFVVQERFEGHFREERWNNTERVTYEDGQIMTEVDLPSQIRDNYIHIPGYFHLPPGADQGPILSRLELEWMFEEPANDTLAVSETFWAGFGARGNGSAALVRFDGLESWEFYSFVRATSFNHTSDRIVLESID